MNDEEHSAPSMSAILYSLRESLSTVRILAAEEEQNLRRRITLFNNVSIALEALVKQFPDIPNPPMRDFPELNNKDEE